VRPTSAASQPCPFARLLRGGKPPPRCPHVALTGVHENLLPRLPSHRATLRADRAQRLPDAHTSWFSSVTYTPQRPTGTEVFPQTYLLPANSILNNTCT